ncbi:hypothetical protein GmHk_13G036437 [Glycine max]|nr:hypothetical protein GmHk_13G036437 [Glycine max]
MCYVQDLLEEQASQGSFVPHGRQDVLTAAIGLIRKDLESVVFHLLAKPIFWLSERPLSTTLLG